MQNGKPEWPKLKRDWVGRRVRLCHKIETRGGTVFRKGRVMRVYKYYRGLGLEVLRSDATGTIREGSVTRVMPYEVELLPE